MKKRLLSILLVLCMSVSLLAGVSFAAENDYEVNLTTVNGAQIRTIGKQGLRFISTIDKTSADFSNVVEFGTILIPSADITDISELQIGATLNGHTVAKVQAKKLYEETDSVITFTAVITNIAEKNYAREYTARAYAIMDDGSVVYAQAGASRSIYIVAKRGLDNSSESISNLVIFQDIVDLVESTPPVETEKYGMIVESVYEYDAATRKHYLALLIASMDDESLISGNFRDVARADLAGNVGDEQVGNAKYAKGNVVNFENDECEFTSVTLREDGTNASQECIYRGEDGFYKVTIIEVDDKNISFYNYGAVKNSGTVADQTLPIYQGFDLPTITIYNNEVVGGDIAVLSANTGITATDYNAVVQIFHGQIIKVFSIRGNI